MGADTEGGMHNLRTMDIKCPWVRAHFRITGGRRKVERHPVARLNLYAAHFHIGARGASDGNDGRVETDRFLYRCS